MDESESIYIAYQCDICLTSHCHIRTVGAKHNDLPVLLSRLKGTLVGVISQIYCRFRKNAPFIHNEEGKRAVIKTAEMPLTCGGAYEFPRRC